jgi:hypothetical protein
MRIGLRTGIGAAALALAFGLSVPAARADSVVDGRLTATPHAPILSRADAYLASGRQNLMLGKAGAAAAELEKAVRLKPTNAYNALWLHYARNKEGAPDSVELQINAARVNRAAWPGPLLDYLTGKIDATAVLTKAGEGPDRGRTNRLCEADLFLGQEQMVKGRRSEGLERLQAAADACQSLPREAELARADLPGQGPPKPVLTQASDPAPRPRSPLAEPTVRPASIRPVSFGPQAQPRAQVLGDPLLRGSLR